MRQFEKFWLNIILVWLYLTLVGYVSLTFFRWNDTWKIDFSRPLEFMGSGTNNQVNNTWGTYDLSWSITSNISWIQSTSWVETDILTWDVITWDQDITIESATDPRSYLDYLLENGEAGKDYIVAIPTNQPAMNAKSWAENNTAMHNYLHKNRISFDLPKNGKQAYIMLVTSKSLSKVGNLFIGIDWKTVWWIDKYAKIPTDAVNEYLYPLCNFQLIGNGWKKFPAKNLCKKEIHNNKISINAVASGGDNKVEKIIIFFK